MSVAGETQELGVVEFNTRWLVGLTEEGSRLAGGFDRGGR